MSNSDPGAADRCPLYNPEVGSINLCTGQVEETAFNYSVTECTCVLFVVLFGISSALHLVQAILSRRWFMLGTIFICAITETLGWSGRLWASISTQWLPTNGGHFASNDTAFLMQISTLIFAPAFLAAFWYITLGYLIRFLGPQYCRFNPTFYSVIFVLGDLASLIVQAIGGGQASAAETLQGANDGARVMYSGVAVQLVVMVAYCILLAEFVVRFFYDKPVKPFRIWKTKPAIAVPKGVVSPADIKRAKILVGAMVFSTVLIFIRSIYRIIELVDGWTGPIISNEALFCTLDGLMVFLATAVFNVIHPMWYLPRKTDDHFYETEKFGDDKKGTNDANVSSRPLQDSEAGSQV
ncbi:RTA1-domain-containing protein [Cystobasidium minutum MCA 4210]|uniref:RTA1-domain-containing protein n=1 Tax=Cystobasidium minutum MCA 4210 TaxID=1397322 RepID=UPI0034CE7A02|eukprot:jgi/Rhomi1/76027/CE76026_7513